MFEKIKTHVKEHEDELLTVALIGSLFVMEYLAMQAAYDRGTSDMSKVLLGIFEKCVDDGNVVLMKPNNAGKLVKTTDIQEWVDIMSKALPSA